jgi:hypothetical protein
MNPKYPPGRVERPAFIIDSCMPTPTMTECALDPFASASTEIPRHIEWLRQQGDNSEEL